MKHSQFVERKKNRM